MNGRANCILEICCEPGSAQQRAALTDEILHSKCLDLANGAGGLASKLDRDVVAESVATWIAETFDLAPKGSLVQFKQTIARLAREPRTR